MVKAPAKINLMLDVLHKRPDDYHEVKMVMTTIDLSDRIELIKLEEDAICLYSHNRFIPNDSRNLAYKAADLLKKRFNVKNGVAISIMKSIPVSAGLAGGSSDAAATLRGLNKIWDLGQSIDQLAELGAEIGSDVSFCVYGGTALVTGRGEKIKHIAPPPHCWVVLAKPSIGISTSEIYRQINLKSIKHPDIEGMVHAIENKDYKGMCNKVANVLEDITLHTYPEVARIKEQMKKFGADAVSMSGSGPTVFGLVQYDSRMQRVYNGLRGFCDHVFAVRMMGERIFLD